MASVKYELGNYEFKLKNFRIIYLKNHRYRVNNPGAILKEARAAKALTKDGSTILAADHREWLQNQVMSQQWEIGRNI